jgi:hypothetical protein
MMQTVTKNSEGFIFMARLMLEYQFKSRQILYGILHLLKHYEGKTRLPTIDCPSSPTIKSANSAA